VTHFDLEYVDQDGACRREGLAQCWWAGFDEVDPVRSFPSWKGQTNLPGLWWSATMGRHVGFESWLERDQAMVLDYRRDVVGFSSQPFWLHWLTDEGPRRHAPDFFARGVDGVVTIVDVRADDRVDEQAAAAFAAMQAACGQVGWRFERAGALPATFCRNLRWISRYRHGRFLGPDGAADRVLAAFGEARPLFDGAAEVGDTLTVLPVIYHLLWRQRLTAELHGAPLGSGTLAQVTRAAG
jgi:hypothetical protein